MCRAEKQKTCITIVSELDPAHPAYFQQYINIPHRVDKIKVTSIGGIIFTNAPAIVPSIFYIDSDLVTNPHDRILGTFANFSQSYNSSTKTKEFSNPSKSVNGNYTFQVYDLQGLLLNTNNGNSYVHIDLEFIESIEG